MLHFFLNNQKTKGSESNGHFPFLVLEGAKMVDQELHQVFERRLREIIPWIVYNSQGSEDMTQEGLLGMCDKANMPQIFYKL